MRQIGREAKVQSEREALVACFERSGLRFTAAKRC
jgi:hypothetical protein